MGTIGIALAVLIALAGMAVRSALRGDPEWQALVSRYSGRED